MNLHLTAPFPCDVTQEMLDSFLARPTIEVVKKTKRSEGVADIRPDIMDLALLGDKKVSAIISAGSNQNLRPDLLFAAMNENIE